MLNLHSKYIQFLRNIFNVLSCYVSSCIYLHYLPDFCRWSNEETDDVFM